MAHDSQETALAVIESTAPATYASIGGMISPLVSPLAARQAITAYEALKQAIVRPEDKHLISGKVFLKKSFWRRIASCFGLSVVIVREEYLVDEMDPHNYGYSIIARATAPNGQYMEADGMCWASEKSGQARTRHNVHAHAVTRAKNRAISDLVGGGEVSADELTEYVDSDPAPQQLAQATRQQNRAQTWAQVRQTGIEKGLKTQEQWDEFCQRHGGKTETDIISTRDAGAKTLVAQAVASYTPEDVLVGISARGQGA